MADQPPFLSPISTFLTSPKFITKKLSDFPETAVYSPVSVLETKNASISTNPFAFHDSSCSKSSPPSPQNQHPDRKKATEAIGLALIYYIVEENIQIDGNFSPKPVNRISLLGSKLKIQIPAINTPSEFGVKTKSSQFKSSFSRSRDLIRHMSLKEMELYEDYTCVITHGTHPKTTHIFDEFIVEGSDDDDCSSPSICDYCKEIPRNDYSGEKTICCEECRFQEMIHSEGQKIEEPLRCVAPP